VKGPTYLANAGVVTLTGAPTTSAEMGLARAGDCNNDNLVSAPDFIILKNTFGKGSADPGYDGRADFTGDAQVSVSDFILLKSSFGSGGAPPLIP
jgi:Dockerin type I domain